MMTLVSRSNLHSTAFRFLWLGILFIVGVTGCEGCRPNQGNLAFIGYSDVPAGETVALSSPMPGSDQNVDFIGRIYYPSYDESVLDNLQNPNLEEIEVANGQHPLVIFGHGRYGGGVPNNYLGMTNLMHHLASWGYICISVNFDVVTSLGAAHEQGIPHRGELFLHATDWMLQQNADPGSLFYQKIDASKIALIGHSRGGGGAISAVNMNFTAGSPRPILAVATISSVDFAVQPIQAAVPHLGLYGSWDGDLYKGQGPRIWDGGVRSAAKHHVEIYGANHFHFTDSVTYANEINGIPRQDHHEIAQGYINAFFDVHVRNFDRFEWPLYLSGEKDLRPGVDEYIQALSSDFLTVDDGSPLGSEASNNLGGANTSSSLAVFDDRMLTGVSDNFYNQSEGLIVQWNGSADNLLFGFAAQNVSAYDHLQFRVSQLPVEPGNPGDPLHAFNTLDTKKNFRVRLKDSSANTSVASIEAYQGGLQYPDLSGSQPAASIYQYKSIPRSYRIPLQAFSGVNLNAVTEIAFLFDQPNTAGFVNTTGAIAVDDVEFAR